MFSANKFKGAVVANGMDMKKIAKRLGIHEATLYRKISDGGNFTRKEIEDLMVVLCIEDPREIFLRENLRKRKFCDNKNGGLIMFWKKKYEKAAAERDALQKVVAERDALRARNEYLLREVHEFKRVRNEYRDAKHNAMLKLSRVRRELADATETIDRKEEQVCCLLVEYQHLCTLLEEHGVDPRRYTSVPSMCRALNDLSGEKV